MGLFQHKQPQKKTPSEEAIDEVDHFFDDDFREELRDYGRRYFERVVNENAALFKQDLDATIAHINTELKQHMARQLDERATELDYINTELKEHVTKQLDEQLADYGKAMKNAQDLVVQKLNENAQALQEQHNQLSAALQRSIANQDAMLAGALKESEGQIKEMKDAQAAALQLLNESAQSLKEQHQQIEVALQKNVAYQQAVLINGFQENMAYVIEHYLLAALGDQFDVKAQLPAIIKQLEANKETIMGDLKL